MDKSNLVSVIIPTYKNANDLIRAVDSVLKQSYKNIEIIVVDDNDPQSESRMRTELVMRKYDDFENIKYIKHEFNKERSAARNTGIKNSEGNFLMFLDNDDEFLKDKVEAQVKCLNDLDSSWGVSYTKYIRKKEDEIVVYSAENREGYLFIEGMKRNLFIHAGSNLMVRKEVIERVGYFNESISFNEDIEFLIRILNEYKIAYVDVLGLVVNINSKGKIDHIKITELYLSEISIYLQKMNESEKNAIMEMINLQSLRYYLSSGGDYSEAYNLFSNRRVTLKNSIRYLLHLSWRRLTKKSYGFKL